MNSFHEILNEYKKIAIETQCTIFEHQDVTITFKIMNYQNYLIDVSLEELKDPTFKPYLVFSDNRLTIYCHHGNFNKVFLFENFKDSRVKFRNVMLNYPRYYRIEQFLK